MSTKKKVPMKVPVSIRGKRGPERGPLRKVSDRAGLTYVQTYRVLVLGTCKPNWDTACRLADAMGISLDQLRGKLERGRRKAA